MTETAKIPVGFTPIISENPFGKAVGPIYEKTGKDGWVRGFLVGEKHTNRGGIAHGGVLMTFADIVLATAALEVADLPLVTIQMNSNFVAPARLGVWVEGRGRITRRTKDLVFVNADLSADGKPILSASGIFKII